MRSLIRLVFFATLFAPPGVSAEILRGKVIQVTDGDTLVIFVDRMQVKVRLSGIDAPERGQPFGNRSRRHLSDVVSGQSVEVRSEKKDRYGRVVGKIMHSGRDINLEQVRAGMAWWYEYYKEDQSKPDQAAYREAEDLARRENIGLWSQPNPINPTDWRSGKRTSVSQMTPTYECGSKSYCRQMNSCEEAKYFLNVCRFRRLDGDADGVPCEKICKQ